MHGQSVAIIRHLHSAALCGIAALATCFSSSKDSVTVLSECMTRMHMHRQEISYPVNNSLAGRYDMARAVLYDMPLCDLKLLCKRSAFQRFYLPVLIPGTINVQGWQPEAMKSLLLLPMLLHRRLVATTADCKAQAALLTAALLRKAISGCRQLTGTHSCSNGCALHTVHLMLSKRI